VKKRRITLNLDEDVVSTLEAIGGRSVSATANAALRDALASTAHWCTLVVSVVEGLPMHPRCRRVIALLA
jgi:hypothetical protein